MELGGVESGKWKLKPSRLLQPMEAMQPLCLLPKPSSFPPLLLSNSSSNSKRSSIPRPSVCFSTKWADRLLGDFNLSTSSSSSSYVESPPNHDNGSGGVASTAALLSLIPASTDRNVTLPIDFYKVLGAEAHFLADGIKRAYDARVSKRPQYGFSPDALIGRRQILNVALDSLSNPQTRIEYTRGILEDRDATIVVDVTWDKVPGALCLLQEAGESEVVLETGAHLLSEKLPKGFKQDIVLAMTLAYVDISRDAMAQVPPDLVRCCEVLERALNLLQEEGATNLAPDLVEQIDDTLEEITPPCVLELLSLPLDQAYRTKREEGLRGVRNILWSVGRGGMLAIGGGFSREGFMNEAFIRMTSIEQIDLYTTAPSNILPELFEVYSVVLAYVAQGVAFRKPHLITRADTLLLQLQDSNVGPSDEIEFSLERGMCALLVGDLEKCHQWLGLDTDSSPHRDQEVINFVMGISSSHNNGEDGVVDLLPGLCKLLETWLVQVVFPRSRDTQEVDFRLRDYYDDPVVLRFLESTGGGSGSHLTAVALAAVAVGATAVKSGTLTAFQKVFPGIMKQFDGAGGETKNIDGGQEINSEESEGLVAKYFDLGIYMKDTTIMLTSAGVAVFVLAVLGLRFFSGKRRVYSSGDIGAASVVENSYTISNDDVTTEEEKGDRGILTMDAKLAESIVRKWQDYKSLAMGPTHQLDPLKEVLDGRMLKIWSERATEMTTRGWHWKYGLVNVSVDSLTVSLDGQHATVEATIEEAARVFDGQAEDDGETDNTYSTRYMTRYEMAYTDSGWKIVDGAILESQ